MALSLTDREERSNAVTSQIGSECLRTAGAATAELKLQDVNVQSTVKDNRLFFIEFLRCFAIMQVMLLHASAPFAVATSAKGLFWVGCILDSFARSCVPLFLLISGMLLLSSRQNESAVDFLKRRFWRVGAPLIAWTIIYTGWRLSKGAHLDWVNIINQPACYHLQYLYYLIGLYLATPILRAFLRGSNKQEVVYFLALWLIATSIFPTISSLSGLQPPILFTVTTGFSGYFILGYALRNYQIPANRNLQFGLIACACLAITVLGTYFLTFSQPNPQLNEALFNYSSPQIIVYSAILFLAAKSLTFKFSTPAGRLTARCIESLSTASFTIYLVHPLFLDFVSTKLKWIIALDAHRSFLTVGYLFAVALVTLSLSWLFFLACRLLKVPSWIAP
ncbi:MAG TPA: hypothetical protein EYN91_26925 [Candidatus Melainabacteria bacterium]|nr:hypothetical protein [Candidatus Melainabacteria bacterium]HIN64956.1 hypothetical protein [Candidatus Obscuribacterales bacterium]